MLVPRSSLEEYPRAALTKCHKLGAENYRNVCSSSSGGQKSEAKVLAGLLSSGRSVGDSVPHLSAGFWGLLAT